MVLNDEAHHCYLPKQAGKSNEEEENERASIWYNGIKELSRVYKLQVVYDLSATPYFL